MKEKINQQATNKLREGINNLKISQCRIFYHTVIYICFGRLKSSEHEKL